MAKRVGPALDGLQADEHRRRPPPLLRQAVVLGNQFEVVRALQPRVGDGEGVEQRLAVADHRVARLPRVLVLLAAQQPDHVKEGHPAVDSEAAERVHRGIEPGVLDHEHRGLAPQVEPGGGRRCLVLGGAGHHPDRPLLVERGQHRPLVGVRHAQDPAQRLVPASPTRLPERLLERVDDQRCGDRFRHLSLPVTNWFILGSTHLQERKSLMRYPALGSIVALLICVSTATGAGVELKTDEQKTFYALGLAIGQNLTAFTLSEAELELVKAGLSDVVLRKQRQVELETWGPKIQELQRTRLTAAAAAEQKAGQAFLDKASAETGATKTASGLIISTIKSGTGSTPK